MGFAQRAADQIPSAAPARLLPALPLRFPGLPRSSPRSAATASMDSGVSGGISPGDSSSTRSPACSRVSGGKDARVRPPRRMASRFRLYCSRSPLCCKGIPVSGEFGADAPVDQLLPQAVGIEQLFLRQDAVPAVIRGLGRQPAATQQQHIQRARQRSGSLPEGQNPAAQNPPGHGRAAIADHDVGGGEQGRHAAQAGCQTKAA